MKEKWPIYSFVPFLLVFLSPFVLRRVGKLQRPRPSYFPLLDSFLQGAVDNVCFILYSQLGQPGKYLVL